MKKPISLLMLVSGLLYISYQAIAMESDSKTLSLSADALSAFDIDAGAGKLSVYGDDNATEISVKARLNSDDFNNTTFTLTLEKRGSKAFLVSKVKHKGNYNAYIDVELTMPSDLLLNIKDGSGAMWVNNLKQGLTIDDGSGAIEVSNVAGEVNIDDGSGSITISDIGSSLNIVDGSGSITIDKVAGHVKVDDGSGSINVDTAQSFELLDDGSGSVNLTNIASE